MAQENQGCLGFLAGLFGSAKTAVPMALPYRTRDNFVSRAELSFYGVLRLVVGERLVICPKVSLGDVFYVAVKEQAQAYRNKIDRKHVDFLLCDPQTLRPVMGIELDDASHQRGDRQERDQFVEQVFEAAGLPIIRMPVRAAYTVDEVGGLLREALALGSGAARPATGIQTAAPAQASQPPVCPKCGIPLVIRESRKDRKRFWGCSNYPRCTQTAPIDE